MSEQRSFLEGRRRWQGGSHAQAIPQESAKKPFDVVEHLRKRLIRSGQHASDLLLDPSQELVAVQRRNAVAADPVVIGQDPVVEVVMPVPRLALAEEVGLLCTMGGRVLILFAQRIDRKSTRLNS